MRAGLVTSHRRFELVDMPTPQADEGLAVVDIALCGVCGTDLHGFLGHTPYNPAICGHDWTGTVSATGVGVRNVSDGDRVVVGIRPACGRCPQCVAGQSAWCMTSFMGMVGRDPAAPKHGGFAPQLAIDAGRLIAVTANISDVQAAIVEPATVCLHAMRRTPIRPGDRVAVVGAGPIGLLTAQLARVSGAGHVTVIEPTEARRALALSIGADTAAKPGEVDRAEFDIVFECAGVPQTIQAGVDLVRRGGTVTMVGFASGEATIQPAGWLTKEVTVITSLGYLHHEFAQTMDLIADGRIRTEPLHTATVGLSELPVVIERLADDPTSAVKVLVDPSR